MQQSYYKYDTRALLFKYGTPEHKFYDYLIRKENYSRLKGLPIGQVDLTVRTVAKDIEVTEKVARRLIKQFIEDDFIELIKKANSKKESSIYILKTYAEKGTVEGTVEDTDRTQLNENIATIEDTKGHGLDTEKDTVEGTPKIDNINRIKNNIYSRVIKHLNEKASKSFKYTTKKTKSCIDARIREGFKEEDFLKVIDIKTKEWKDNPDMSKYLRPETLFGTKFESYLQQEIKQNQSEQQFKSLYGANKL